MKAVYKDHTPTISIPVLATLCFITLLMCQTRFKISKEMSRDSYPPVLRSRDCWFLYTIGNPDRFRCVLRAIIVISSPVLSLISTVLLVFGKTESNPYFFIPWLFLTIKGLLLVQTDNLVTILRDMATRTNYAFGFRADDLKWLLFYFTIFLIDLVEAFSFCEIFDLFLVLWNHNPTYNEESKNLEVVRKEINEIMNTFSKCSLGSLSKISMGSLADSDESNECEINHLRSIVKFSLKDEQKLFDANTPVDSISKGSKGVTKKKEKKSIAKKESPTDCGKTDDVQVKDMKLAEKITELKKSRVFNSKSGETNEATKHALDNVSLGSFNNELQRELASKPVFSADALGS